MLPVFFYTWAAFCLREGNKYDYYGSKRAEPLRAPRCGVESGPPRLAKNTARYGPGQGPGQHVTATRLAKSRTAGMTLRPEAGEAGFLWWDHLEIHICKYFLLPFPPPSPLSFHYDNQVVLDFTSGCTGWKRRCDRLEKKQTGLCGPCRNCQASELSPSRERVMGLNYARDRCIMGE